MNIGVTQKGPATTPAFYVCAGGVSSGSSTTRAEREWVLPVTPISMLHPCGAAFEARWHTHRASPAAMEGEAGAFNCFLLGLLLLRGVLIEDRERKFVERVGIGKLLTSHIQLCKRPKGKQGFLFMDGERLLKQRFRLDQLLLRRVHTRKLVEVICYELMLRTECRGTNLQGAFIERSRFGKSFLLGIE